SITIFRIQFPTTSQRSLCISYLSLLIPPPAYCVKSKQACVCLASCFRGCYETMTIMSVTAVARASALLASVLMMAAGAESGARKPGIDPLSALDNNDLVDLLDMELDEVFLLPKTTLQDGHHRHRPHLSEKESNAFKRHHRPHHRHNNNGSKNNKRNLQEEDREESMFSSPSPTVGSLSRGVSSSYMTDSWPSSAPTAAPTM
ncbi:unnamed protein product, partial [Pylaiella littoralis]